jgi:uncharacterized protein YbjT (DUF2867 family)
MIHDHERPSRTATSLDARPAVFLTGATGYLGSRLAARLAASGHAVRALVRAGSESRAPRGCAIVTGDALRAETFAPSLRAGDTLVHLVGVAHPSPAKAPQFRTIDLASVRASVEAARGRGVAHFVYVSVAQPAPAMRAYVAARAEGEAAVRSLGVPATFLRPWYVLGPGHWWPFALLPFYSAAELVPAWRETSRRLRPVRLGQMLAALERAVASPPPAGAGPRIVDADAIRAASRSESGA